jgi:ribosomal protein S12 methylthiotransferase
MKLGVVSLGCDKATVDSETLLARLVGHGAEYTTELRDADVVVVNTCGFIDAAKRESIEALLGAARLKVEGRCRAVVGVGCLVARYREELARELPEVDYWFVFRDLPDLLPTLQRDGLLGDPADRHPEMRLFFGDKPHVRYLKISEGCDHTCAFCAIPLMRGRHRSRPLEELVREAQELEDQGAMEINLVAQDLGHYGRDVPGGPRLPDLVRALLRDTSVPWFRCLYVYSAGLTQELVELWATEPRLAPYVDMPIQHASDRVLKLMRRPERQATIRDKLAWLRESVPAIAIRTTVLVGFPTETDAEFRELLGFVDEVQFDRLGALAYSPQEGTRAAALPDDVPEAAKRERLEEVLELQRAISAERPERMVGRELRILVDQPAGAGEPSEFVGRTAADDVDGCTYLVSRSPLVPGSFVPARVTAALDYDLVAEPAG